MGYLTAKQFSEIWGITERRIIKLCRENRINGAIKNGMVWEIPEETLKPSDKRSNIYKYINIINIYSNIGWNQELLTLFNHNRELCTALIVFITAVYSFACTLKTYGDKERIHDAMMLPTSHKAKFFAEVLYSLVFIPLVMCVILFVTDIATALICQNSEENIVLINADKEYIYSLPSF